MSCYRFFEIESNYIKNRDKAFEVRYDTVMRSYAIHEFKMVYGSVLRKLMEVTGKKRGHVLNGDIIKETFQPYGLDSETIQFVICQVEAYNNDGEYKKRKIIIRQNIKDRTIKKRFHDFQRRSYQEFKLYRPLYNGSEEKLKYHDMKAALIIYNELIKTFFMRRLPKKIPAELYEECIQIKDAFRLFYKKEEGQVAVCKMSSSEKRKLPGFYDLFGQEIALLFALYFLRLKR